MYYVVYGLLWLVSLLPLPVLYVVSDGLYGILYYITRYRRDVVMANLQLAFPEKTDEERKRIAKKFYHNLADTFIETLKLISASQELIRKRFRANWEMLDAFSASTRPVQLLTGHNFNWEWGNAALAEHINYPYLAVYMPITNKVFERLFKKLRSRTGTTMLRATHMREDFLPFRDRRYLLGLVADQNPGRPEKATWFNFFGKPTPFIKGPAKNAIAGDAIVLFVFVHKLKRGYYTAVLTTAVESSASLTETELIGKFVTYLEGVIREYPEMWLWSHRRWKWDWKEEYGPVHEAKELA